MAGKEIKIVPLYADTVALFKEIRQEAQRTGKRVPSFRELANDAAQAYASATTSRRAAV